MRSVALVLLALAACGDDDSSGRGEVTVRVTRDGMPIAEAPVVFHDATGSVLGTAETDASGVAVGSIGTRGAVTVFDPGFDDDITTITRVEIGSTLEVPLRATGFPGPLAWTLMITAPTTPPPPDTAGYGIQTPCGREFVESLPATIGVPEPCGPGAPMIVVAYAPQVLDSPSRSLAWVATRVGDDNIARFGAWSTDCSIVSLATDVTLDLRLWPRFGMQAFDPPPLTFCELATPAQQPTLDFGEGVVVQATASVEESPMRTTRLVRDLEALQPALQITAADDLLIGAIALDSFDAEGLSWNSNDALASADAIDVMVDYFVETSAPVHWRFVLPPSARGTLLPEVPSELNTWGTFAHADRAVVDIRYLDASWVEGDLADVHRDLPLILGPPTSRYDLVFSASHDIPRGSALRDYWQTLVPAQ